MINDLRAKDAQIKTLQDQLEMKEATKDTAIRKVQEELEKKIDEAENLKNQLHDRKQDRKSVTNVSQVLLFSFLVLLLAALVYTTVNMKANENIRDLQQKIVTEFATTINDIKLEKMTLKGHVKTQQDRLERKSLEISTLWRRNSIIRISCLKVCPAMHR